MARILVLGVAVAAAGCAAGDGGDTCSTAEECGPGRECVGGRCVAADGGPDDVPDEPESGGCIDEDGDGRGRGCAAGFDCDDTDRAHFDDCEACFGEHPPAGCVCLVTGETRPCYEGPSGTLGAGICASGLRRCDETGHMAEGCDGQVLPQAREVCDGLGRDDDCDGEGDEALLGECGDCDSTCRTVGDIGPDPRDPGATGLIPNPDGPGVTLGFDELAAGFAWIANADEGTVSKLDLATGAEVSRFRVGLTGTALDSPSRTAVDGAGNAYVAGRAHVSAEMTQGSVTKMAGDRRYCADRNADGTIETSTGPSPMSLGRDECVLWTVPACAEGGIPRALAVDPGDPAAPEGYPWVGCFGEMRFLKLDPHTGAVLAIVDIGVNPYGAALDRDGWIWAAGMRPLPGHIQRFSPATLEVEARVPAEGSGCASADETRRAPYGITTDPSGRVWVTGFDRFACRWDPAAGNWLTVSLPRTITRGIAADAGGTVWVSNYDWHGNGVVSFRADDGSALEVFSFGAVAPIGVGIDMDGNVWTVNQTSNSATRLRPSARAVDHFPVGAGPYTYSDFTGYHRRTMVPRGVWTRDFERCAEGIGDRWGSLSWDSDVPPGASITFLGASAATPGRLASAPVVTIARAPPAVPPVEIEAAFAAAGVETHRLLRLTIVLEAGGGGAPVLRDVRVQWHCSRLE
ncbi:MAG: hypothetical protein QME96_02060 [Myxococcota bacterium]|nr:hypothetical protein [Myxococcota bacterium]